MFMTVEIANEICGTLTGATHGTPFGEGVDVWKVGDKMFVLIGLRNAGITVKCADADTAAMLIDVGAALPAPYLKRGGWVLIPWDTIKDRSEMEHRIQQSYDTVFTGLTKKKQAEITAAS